MYDAMQALFSNTDHFYHCFWDTALETLEDLNAATKLDGTLEGSALTDLTYEMEYAVNARRVSNDLPSLDRNHEAVVEWLQANQDMVVSRLLEIVEES